MENLGDLLRIGRAVLLVWFGVSLGAFALWCLALLLGWLVAGALGSQTASNVRR